MKNWKSLSILLLILSSSANAALINENFTATVLQGDFIGTVGNGSFAYDDSLISGIGNEFINISDGLTVNFTAFGQNFLESDDIQYTDTMPFPQLSFVDGVITELDFFVSEVDVWGVNDLGQPVIISKVLTNIDQGGVFNFSTLGITALSEGGYEGELFVNSDVSPIPVPGALWLFFSGLIGLAGFTKR